MIITPWKMGANTRASAQNSDGFTLIELLTAVTLLSFVLVLAFGGLRFGAKAWESGDQKMERLSELQVTHRVVTRILSRAFPLVMQDNAPLRYAFDGTATGVNFVAYMPHYPDVAGPYLIRLEIIETERGNELRLKRAPFTPSTRDLDLTVTDEDTPLLETPYRMAFSYFNVVGDNGDGEWLDRWDDDEQMPTRVRLRVYTPDDGALLWPDLVARLHINMDSTCLIADPEGLCRLRK
jgi:general secretion pathway protein J